MIAYCTKCDWSEPVPLRVLGFDIAKKHWNTTMHTTTFHKEFSYGETMRAKEGLPDKT